MQVSKNFINFSSFHIFSIYNYEYSIHIKRLNYELKCDFLELASKNEDHQLLENRTILITGATGMLARYLTRYLIYLNEEKHLNMRFILAVRNIEKAKKIYHDQLNNRIHLLATV